MALTHKGAFDESAATDVAVTLGTQLSLYNVAGPSTAPVGLLTGTDDVFVLSSNAAPGTLTTRTAAQMYADLQLLLGLQNINNFAYTLQITNSGAGTLTLAGVTGVTLSGTATVVTNTFRQWAVVVTNSGIITLTTTGVGTYS